MKRGFTLLEVLLVLVLMSIFLGMLTYSFYSTLKNSYAIVELSELTKEEAKLLWNLQRKLSGALELYVKKDSLFMLTSAGDYYQGVVKCAYIFKDGWLYYYEFPYPYGELTFYEEDRLIRVGRFEGFQIRAYVMGNHLEEYRGVPEVLEFKIGGKTLKFGVKSE
ncbi:MAG: prepilin-type N-terminal cleavage/methylation domain-containing protein [Acidobacteria bacterium]|jgi:prepilin-type N-terminal cleavage/methylation domain-containing protein|nr:MAG: prepilin-type N-terminal cleavage/methylation domain-containing protein [Acidobacteriota bacterium]